MRSIFKIVIALIVLGSSSCTDDAKSTADTEPNKVVNKAEDDRDTWLNAFEVVRQWKDVLPGKTIMEIGANDGYWTYKLASGGAHVIAADVSQEKLDAITEGAKRRGLDYNIETRLIDPNEPYLKAGEVDMVFLIDQFAGLANRVEFCSKINRGLNKTGQLVIMEWLPEQTPHGPPFSERADGMNVMDEMELAGFMDVAIRTDFLNEHWVMVAQGLPEGVEAP